MFFLKEQGLKAYIVFNESNPQDAFADEEAEANMVANCIVETGTKERLVRYQAYVEPMLIQV